MENNLELNKIVDGEELIVDIKGRIDSVSAPELEEYINELRTIKLEEIDKIGKGFLDIKRYSCLLNNGKEIIRERIVKNGKDGSAAIILPITKEGNVLAVSGEDYEIDSLDLVNLSEVVLAALFK